MMRKGDSPNTGCLDERIGTRSIRVDMMQSVDIEAPHVPFVPLIPLANKHRTRFVLDFVDHHGLTAGIELHQVATPK